MAADDAATVAVRSFAGSTAARPSGGGRSGCWPRRPASAVFLVAGLQLSKLGALGADHGRGWVIALTGLALALAGVGWVITRAAALLTEDWITLSQLTLEDFRRRLYRRETAEGRRRFDLRRHRQVRRGALRTRGRLAGRALPETERCEQESPGTASAGRSGRCRRRLGCRCRDPSGGRRRCRVRELSPHQSRLRGPAAVLVKAAIVIVTGVVVFAIAALHPVSTPTGARSRARRPRRQPRQRPTFALTPTPSDIKRISNTRCRAPTDSQAGRTARSSVRSAAGRTEKDPPDRSPPRHCS